MNNCPTKFFGVELTAINSIDDAVAAVVDFCRKASPEEVSRARNELRKLSIVDRKAYLQINDLLFSLQFSFDDPAWDNRFALLNAGL